MLAVKIILSLFAVISVVFFLWVAAIMPKLCKHPLTEKIKSVRYAHRGLFSHEDKIPENSLAAFSRAIEKGYGFELDVHLTADKKLAVIHDSSLKRTAGVDIDISKVTYDEISHCRLEGTNEKIPLLSEVLELCQGRVPIMIEMKIDSGNARELACELVSQLHKYDGPYCVESFYPDALIALKKADESIMRGQLSCNIRRNDKQFSRLSNFILKNLLTNFLTRPDFISYAWEDRGCVSFSMCRAMFSPSEFLWTVKDKKVLETSERFGAGVIFDSFDPCDDPKNGNM